MPIDPNSLIGTDGLFPTLGQEPGGTSLAQAEAQALYGTDETRQAQLKHVVHGAIIWAVRIASFGMICLFIVRIAHLAIPDAWMWLDKDRLQKIDSLLFSGFLGAFVARYLNQAMPNGASQPLRPPSDISNP